MRLSTRNLLPLLEDQIDVSRGDMLAKPNNHEQLPGFRRENLLVFGE